MNILFYDEIQDSDAPEQLKTASLADTWTPPAGTAARLNIILNEAKTINCIGVGNITNKLLTSFIVGLYDDAGVSISGGTGYPYQGNGLYLFSRDVENVKRIFIQFGVTSIGRIAAGKAVNIKTSIPKEPVLCSTNSPRVTLGGQVIEGLNGYNYRRVSLDTRYKIDRIKMSEIMKGYPQISRGLPMFIDFEDEKDRLPFTKLYACDTMQQEMSFESSINKNLFSRKFVFEERF